MRDKHVVEYDWFRSEIPRNVDIGDDVYIDSSYGWAQFHSLQNPGCVIGDATGIFDRATLIVGPEGRVDIGAYVCLSATFVLCRDRVSIGDHVMTAWGGVITDHWIGPNTPLAARRAILRSVLADPDRKLPSLSEPRPVIIEDNVWLGFDCIILPGVTVGRGSVIGAKVPVSEDVPPYSVVAGAPPRIVKTLDPNDTDEVKRAAFAKYLGNFDETGGNIRGTF